MLMATGRWADDVFHGPPTEHKLPRTLGKPLGSDGNMRAHSNELDPTGRSSGRQRAPSADVSPAKRMPNGLNKRDLGINQYSYAKHSSNRHTPRVTVNNFAVRNHREGTKRTTTPRSAWTAPGDGDGKDRTTRDGSLAKWVDSVNMDDNNKHSSRSTGVFGKQRGNIRNSDDVDSHSTVVRPDSELKVSSLAARNGSTSGANNYEQWEINSVSSRSSGFTSVSAVDRSKTPHYGITPRPSHDSEHLPTLQNYRRHSATAPSGEVFSPRGSVASRSHTVHGGDLDTYRPLTAVPITPNIDMILDMAMKQIDDTHRMSEHLSFAQSKKKDFNSKSSSEFKKVLEQINIEDDDAQSQSSGGGGFGRLRRGGRKLSKNWSSLRSKLRNVQTPRPAAAGGNNRRVSDTVPTIDEEKEGDVPDKQKKKTDNMSRPLGKGWRIVKANLKKIVQMADEGKIEPGPNFRKPILNPFKSLRDIIMGKEFQMMMRRKASFIENGVFQFEAAKQDLYARYKPIPTSNLNNKNNVVQKKVTKRISSSMSR